MEASLTPKGREAMVRCVVEDGLSKAAAAKTSVRLLSFAEHNTVTAAL